MCWFLPCETFCSTWINYSRVAFDLCLGTSPGAQHFIGNWVSFPRRWLCKKNTFQYERLCAKTHFETEVRATCNWLIAILMRQTFYILLYSFVTSQRLGWIKMCKIVSVTKFALTIQRWNRCSWSKFVSPLFPRFCGLLQFPGETRTKSFQQLCIFLCHKYPQVRSAPRFLYIAMSFSVGKYSTANECFSLSVLFHRSS